nr:zinc finger protein 544-like [Oncorhynchus nerka]
MTSADAEAAGPGESSLVKQERTEGDDPRHSRDIQTGVVAGVVPPLATEDPAAPPQPKNRCSIMEVEIHQRMHTGEKLLGCHLYWARFSDSYHMKRHQRVHTGEKPFSFPQWSRLMPSDWVHKRPGPGSSLPQLPHRYPTNTTHNSNNTQTMARGQGESSNTNHMRVVAPTSTSSGVIGSQCGRLSIRTDADKPYACPTCGKRFAQANYVKMHQTVHTKEKPFKCKLCYKSFSFLTNLTRHRSVHNGEKS